jgi:hypothetical protein
MSTHKKTLPLKAIKSQAAELLEKLDKLLNENVPRKGDKTVDCQHLTIRCSLSELEDCFSSLTKEDLTPDEDWEGVNRQAGYLGL